MTWNQDSYYYNVELHFVPRTTLYSIRFRTPNAYVEDAPFVIEGVKYTPRLSGSIEKMLAESFVANRVIIANVDRLLNIITFESGNGSGGSSRVPDIFGDGSDGELIVRSGQNLILPVPVPDQSIIEKNYSSILIEAGGTLSCASRNAGLILRCQGDCTIQGTIDQSLKSPKTNPNNNYQYPPELICGDGGNGSPGGRAHDGSPGQGGTGMKGRPYGGGWSGGGGAAGACRGSAKPGGSADQITVDVPDDQLFRAGKGTNQAGIYGGGSVPNFTIEGRAQSGVDGPGVSQPYNTQGIGGNGNIGGGVVLLFVGGKLSLEGSIVCNGGNGGLGSDGRGWLKCGDVNYETPDGGDGGGAGGGAIYVEYFNEILNTASLQVSPGTGANPGTAGTVTIKKHVEQDK